jgi:hypothetical protein
VWHGVENHSAYVSEPETCSYLTYECVNVARTSSSYFPWNTLSFLSGKYCRLIFERSRTRIPAHGRTVITQIVLGYCHSPEAYTEVIFCTVSSRILLTLHLLTTTIVAPPSNDSKGQMGVNSAFKGLKLPFTDNPIITSFITYSIEKALLSKLRIISVHY